MILLTLEQYNELMPYEKGYVCYYQASWPKSPIPDVNPYPEDSEESREFQSGQQKAYIEVLDGEE